MRLESLNARTCLLVVIAGWAILIWLLSLMGLGERLAAVDSRDKPPPNQAQLPPSSSWKLRELAHYADIAASPLFAEDRKPREFQLEPDVKPEAIEQVRLTGVLITPSLQMVTLQTNTTSLRLRLNGPEVNGWRLLTVEPRAAEVTGPGGIRSLELETYAGRASSTVGGSLLTTSALGATSGASMRRNEPPPGQLGQGRASAASPTTQTAQEQVELVRQRIEAQRRELMQQQQGHSPVPKK